MSPNVSSSNPPEDLTAQAVEPEENGSDFLLIKDCHPWETPANEDAIRGDGETFNRINAAGFADTALDEYRAIVIPSTQTSSYYRTLAEQREKIASFVENGGLLIAHVTDGGWPCTAYWDNSFLPKGTTHVTTLESNLSLESPDHPVYEGVDDADLDGWGASAHGYLTNVPDSANVLVGVADDPLGKPTHIEYTHGEGKVLATTQTLEWAWGDGEYYVPDRSAAKQILKNEVIAEDATEHVEANVSVLSFIPGESENSTRGGDAFDSSVMQIFPRGFEISKSLTIDAGWLGEQEVEVEFDPNPMSDDWFTGDMVETSDYPTDLEAALSETTDKYEEQVEDAEDYRLRNEVDVAFDVTDKEIDRSSVEVTFIAGKNPSIVEQEGINTLQDEFTESAIEAGYKPRHYNIESTEVAGTDAIRIATVMGGFSNGTKSVAQLARDTPADEFFFDHLEWNLKSSIPLSRKIALTALNLLTDNILEMLVTNPNIYQFLEIVVTADGEKYVRVRDSSVYPEHAIYVGGQRRENIIGFPDETDGSLRKYVNPNIVAFFAAASLGVTPYTWPEQDPEYILMKQSNRVREKYNRVMNNLVSTVVPEMSDQIPDYEDIQFGNWMFGMKDGEELPASEIETAIPSANVADPFDTELSHDAAEEDRILVSPDL